MRTRLAAVAAVAVVVAFLLGVVGPAGAAPKVGKGGIGALTVSPNPVDEGSTATISGNLDTQCQSNTVHVDWGDGTLTDYPGLEPGAFGGQSGNGDITHVYADDDPTGTPSDDVTVSASFSGDGGCQDGSSQPATTKLTVANADPHIDSLDAVARGPRQTTSLDGTFSDPGTADSYQVTINWGDGTANTVLLMPAIQKIRTGHAYATTGDYRIHVDVVDDDGGSDRANTDVTVPSVSPRVLVSPDASGPPVVNIFNQQAQSLGSFSAYRSSFTGGVRVAAGDVNGDGVDDIITGAGAGGASVVKLFNGISGNLVTSFFAYRSSFTGGVFVAAGDLDGDGQAEIITGADGGGAPLVRMWQFGDGSVRPIGSFLAYRSSFTGGVRVAVGDVNGDGKADIVTAPGAGGSPHVKVFSEKAGGTGGFSASQEFFAFRSSFTGGVYVAAGDVNGDGTADIVTAPGAGGSPLVKMFSNDPAGGLATTQSFFAYRSSFTGGVRVAVGDFNGDGIPDILAAPGPGGGPLVKVFDGSDEGTLMRSFFAFRSSFTGGVFVGYATVPQSPGA